MLKKGSRGARSSRGSRMFSEDNSVHKFSRIKNTNLLDEDDEIYNTRNRQDQLLSNSNASSPYNDRSSSSPMDKSPWSSQTNVNVPFEDIDDNFSDNVLMGSLVREEGHIYSLATSGDLLYTGSDSRNIRVWKNRREFAGFKSNSGLVKAIVISDDRIFTGHQDGKIRVWKVSSRDPSVHKRVGTLPTMKDYIKNSMKISNYFEVKRHKNAVWFRHYDAISCLSLSEDKTFLYSSSWDKTFKVWRISNSRCIESVIAHDDSVNSIVTGFDGLVFTGSADGTVKATMGLSSAWRQREMTSRQPPRGDGFLYSGSLDKSVKMWRVSENSVPVAWKGCASGAPIAIPSSLPAAPSFEARNRVDGIQN
ncbi:hypothetical protein OIU76_002198 [Salix suchowensis]|nr:hypothetical protein OIU76_002198 [Salix suchowensis]